MDEVAAAALYLLSKQVRFERKLAKMAARHASSMDAEVHEAEARLLRAKSELEFARASEQRAYVRGLTAAMEGVRIPVLAEGDRVEIRMGQALLSGTVVRHGMRLGIEVAD